MTLSKKQMSGAKDDLCWRFGSAELEATECTVITEVFSLHWSLWNHHIHSWRRTWWVGLTSGCPPNCPVYFSWLHACGESRFWQCVQGHINLPWLPFQRKEKGSVPYIPPLYHATTGRGRRHVMHPAAPHWIREDWHSFKESGPRLDGCPHPHIWRPHKGDKDHQFLRDTLPEPSLKVRKKLKELSLEKELSFLVK